MAAASTSSIEDHSGRGSAASASRRERSSRLSIRRLRRVASSMIAAASSSRSSRGCDPQRLGGGQDRGQRRAQVVGDPPQQRGLDHVAAAQRGGLDDVGHSASRSSAAASRDSSDGHDPHLDAPQHRLGPVDDQRADLACALAQRETCPSHGARRRSPRSAASKRPREPLARPRAASPPGARRAAAAAPSRRTGRPPGGAARPPRRAGGRPR